MSQSNTRRQSSSNSTVRDDDRKFNDFDILLEQFRHAYIYFLFQTIQPVSYLEIQLHQVPQPPVVYQLIVIPGVSHLSFNENH